MADADSNIESIAKNLGAVFRHMFPGILILGAAWIAHPEWFSWLNRHSWRHLSWPQMIVIAAIVLTIGNVWFVLNRYVVHQLIEALLLYPSGRAGPKNKKEEKDKTRLHRYLLSYVQALGEYTCDALFSRSVPGRARQHVSFRASAVLFIYMVGEVGLVFSYHPTPGTLFAGHEWPIRVASVVILVAGFWQDVLTERIDRCIVEKGKAEDRAEDRGVGKK